MSIASGSDRRAIPIVPTAESNPHRAANVVSRMESPTAAPEIVRLRIRIEALEHLVILLLGSASRENLEAVRELKNDVAFQHPASLDSEMSRAAAHMILLVERSDGLRTVDVTGY